MKLAAVEYASTPIPVPASGPRPRRRGPEAGTGPDAYGLPTARQGIPGGEADTGTGTCPATLSVGDSYTVMVVT